jgi:hypothetical protein
METKPTQVRSFWWVYLVAAVLSGGLTGFGVWLAVSKGIWTLLASGSAALLVVLSLWPIAVALARGARAREQSLRELLTPVYERLEQFSVQLNEISEQQLISERAKELAYRSKDIETLRRAINEEILRREWDPALSLVDALEQNFGYRAEAETLRQEIAAKRNEAFRRSLNEAAAVIERYVSMEQWSAAFKEAERMSAVYPDNEQVRNLALEIESRRQGTKRKLVDDFYAAVNRKDVDGGIELLRRLDNYLSPAEAESLQDAARNLFKEKLAQLRTQFTLAVQEHNWTEAARVGEVIVRDFPNTQMAKEVREMSDTLRQRAAQAEAVGV